MSRPAGLEAFRHALRRLRQVRTPPPPRAELPRPRDPFEAWVDYRLCQLENWQTWIVRLLLGSLAVQVGLKLLELLR
ncbi:MAG: hypothetical protein DDG58_10960 [Ardenticatenia bacterium]|jgi:hypothetical protein|nr:MAG: hypothetical protein DDG58_10960 [Ardenticatenia bacterium]